MALSSPTGQALPDDAARHSIRYRLDSTLFVEAAAGSGKTTALVSRIVEMLRCGACSLDSLAAITFTEAGALELKVRVRQALVALAETSRDAEEIERARAALDQLDEAAISTIHGFCQRLLAEHPIEAGLAPRIEILDEVQQSLAWREHWSSVLDRVGGDPGLRRLFSVAAVVGVTPIQLEALAKEAGDGWDRCGAVGPDTQAVTDAVGSAVERETAVVVHCLGRALALAAQCTDPEDKLFARLLTARDLHDRLMAAGRDEAAEVEAAEAAELAEAAEAAESAESAVTDERLFLLAVARPPFNVGQAGQRSAWACDIDDVRACLSEAQAAMERAVAAVCDAVLPALVATFDLIAREAAAARRLDGKLVFHDLLVLARDLLAGSPEVLERVRRKFRFVLIDEFQDTDPLQLEIAELIGRGFPTAGSAPATPTSAASPAGGAIDAGRLFFVGDPKQSIYRFRGADLAAYRLARDRLVESGPLPLTSNFRSVPGIAEFVNECFGVLMAEYSGLHAVRDEGAAHPPVRIVGGPLDPSMRRHEQRVVESDACAAVIERAVRSESWLVDEGGKTRPARMSDVAILVPRRTGLAELETALDARGIGYRVESASLIYRTQEVRDLLALCRSIDDPSDRIALLAALRSPAFGCGDDDLLAFKRQGGSWSIEEPVEAPGAEAVVDRGAAVVDDAIHVLAGYRSRRFELGAVGVLEEAVRDRRILQLAAGSPRARETWRRVRWLTERARAFVEGGGGGLREFADWVEEQLSEGLRSVESVLPEPDEDVVHILTVHAAKGLEYPITVLAGFGTSDDVPAGVGRKVFRDPGNAVQVRLNKRLETSGFASVKADDDALEREEAIRVLYVAATRARDHLVVCGHHVPPKGVGSSGTLGQRLYEVAQAALVRRPGLWEAIGSLDEGGEGAPDEGGDDTSGTTSGSQATSSQPAGASGSSLSSQPLQRALFDVTEVALLESGVVAQRPGRLPAASPDDWQKWHRDREQLLARITRRKSVRATEVAGLAGLTYAAGQHGHSDERQLEPDFQPEPEREAGKARRGRGGTQLGRAVHATLQSISLSLARQLAAGGSPSPELRALAGSEARAERIGDRTADVERLVLAALSSPSVRDAFTGGAPRREVYVATTVDGVVLDGYLDLCIEEDGGLTVVDYKTDTIRDRATIEAAAERYGLQAAAYALALRDATGLPVRRCVLVFLTPPNQPIEYEVPDLAAAVERVRAIVAGAA
jgi:ATP-dependent exoDNAse (exonuclease V) beta subunit